MKNNLLESYIQNSLKIIIKEDTEYVEVEDIDKGDFENMTFGEFLSGLKILIKEKENIKKKENQKKYNKAAVKSALILFSAGWSEVAFTALDLGGAIATVLKQEEENNNLKGFPSQFKLPEETTKIFGVVTTTGIVGGLIKRQ